MAEILVCVDFSPLTPRIIETAKDLALAKGIGLHLVHGQPEKTTTPTTVVSRVQDKDEAKTRMKEVSQLAVMAQTLEDDGIPCTYSTPAGKIVDVLVAEAKKVHAPYVVLGSHGNGAVYHLVVGSVAAGLLKNLGIPVILVPAQV